MTNSNMLKAIFISNGKTQQEVAKLMGISQTCLNNKIHNKVDFKAKEILKLCDIFKIENKEEIFFANCVEKKSTKNK